MIEPEAMPKYIGRTSEGVLLVLGSNGHWDGRRFELAPNGHGTEVYLVGGLEPKLVATYQSFSTASMAYDVAATKNTMTEAVEALEQTSVECHIQAGSWVVYVLHFDRKVGTARGNISYNAHAQHYVGCTNDLERRMKEHKSGNGKASPLVRELMKLGGTFQIAQLYSYGSDMSMAFGQESYLKSLKGTPRFCAICQEDIQGDE